MSTIQQQPKHENYYKDDYGKLLLLEGTLLGDVKFLFNPYRWTKIDENKPMSVENLKYKDIPVLELFKGLI